MTRGHAPQDAGRREGGGQPPPPQAALQDGGTPTHDGALYLDVFSYREAVTRERLEVEADKVRGVGDPLAHNARLFCLILCVGVATGCRLLAC